MRKFLNDIPIGKKNAITREALAAKWSKSDRETRRTVAELRTFDDGSNMVIVSVSRGRGYYRTDDLEEIGHFIAEMRKRTCNIFKAIRLAQRISKRLQQKQKYGEGLAE